MRHNGARRSRQATFPRLPVNPRGHHKLPAKQAPNNALLRNIPFNSEVIQRQAPAQRSAKKLNGRANFTGHNAILHLLTGKAQAALLAHVIPKTRNQPSHNFLQHNETSGTASQENYGHGLLVLLHPRENGPTR